MSLPARGEVVTILTLGDAAVGQSTERLLPVYQPEWCYFHLDLFLGRNSFRTCPRSGHKYLWAGIRLLHEGVGILYSRG